MILKEVSTVLERLILVLADYEDSEPFFRTMASPHSHRLTGRTPSGLDQQAFKSEAVHQRSTCPWPRP